MKKHFFSFMVLSMMTYTVMAANDSSMAHHFYPRPPLYGIPAKTLPAGKFIYRSYFTFTSYTQMLNKESGEMVGLPSGMDFKSYSYTPKLRVGITNKLTLIANFPLYYKQMAINGSLKQGQGIGDVIFAGLYRFYFNKQKKLLFSGLLFTKYPTGKTTGLSADQLPLGTGSFDGGVAILPEKEFGKLDLRAAAFYIFRGKNRSGINLGDVQQYYVTAAYNFSRTIIAEGTLLYKTTGLNTNTEGISMPYTNTNITQLILGVQFRLAPTFLIQAAFPSTLNAKTPYSSPYEIWLGIYYLL